MEAEAAATFTTTCYSHLIINDRCRQFGKQCPTENKTPRQLQTPQLRQLQTIWQTKSDKVRPGGKRHYDDIGPHNAINSATPPSISVCVKKTKMRSLPEEATEAHTREKNEMIVSLL